MSKQFPEPAPELVIIIAESVERKDSKIEMSEIEKANAQKKQSRGNIFSKGSAVPAFWEINDYISFYRNAATTINVDGTEYLVIYYGHILCKIIER